MKLFRVPPDFYTKMWSLLERCQGISVGGKVLPNSLTHEMTSGEMKFHLRCETTSDWSILYDTHL